MQAYKIGAEFLKTVTDTVPSTKEGSRRIHSDKHY